MAFIFIILLGNAVLPAFVCTALSLLYIAAYLTSTRFAVPRDIARYLPIPIVLSLIGILGSGDKDMYDVLKDGWYFVNPIIIFAAGYMAMRRMIQLELLIKIFLAGGTLLSLLHLALILSDISLLINASVEELHRANRAGYLLSALCLALVLITKRQGMQLFEERHNKALVSMIIVLNAVSVFLSLTRTYWLSLIVLLLFGTGMIMRRKLRWLLILCGLIIGLQTSILIIPRAYLSTATMFGKMANSLNEIIITDYYTMGDIQMHWRGYESYMALQTYLNGNIFNFLAGHGFGKLVDLKIAMLMGGEKMRFIPILHNGYMYVLVKTGLMGLILYLLYIAQFIRTGMYYRESIDDNLTFTGNVIVALAMVLLVTTFVAAGMFNKSMFTSVMLLLGCLLSYGRIRNTELAQGDHK